MIFLNGMKNSRIRRFGFIAFVIYFCLLACLPDAHCHAADALSENTVRGLGYDPDDLPFLADNQCCELHESGHADGDERHIHFLLADYAAAPRNNTNDTSLVPQVPVSVDEFFLKPYFHVVGIIDSTAYFHQEALRPYFSGLSPPLS